MSQELVHVISLAGEEQLALRLILGNYTKMLIRAYMVDVAAENADEAAVNERWKRVCRSIDQYDAITSSMPTMLTFGKGAKPQLYRFLPRGIRLIIQAIETFDSSKNAGLEVEEIQVIESVGEILRERFLESSKYYYTNEELQTAMRSKG